MKSYIVNVTWVKYTATNVDYSPKTFNVNAINIYASVWVAVKAYKEMKPSHNIIWWDSNEVLWFVEWTTDIHTDTD